MRSRQVLNVLDAVELSSGESMGPPAPCCSKQVYHDGLAGTDQADQVTKASNATDAEKIGSNSLHRTLGLRDLIPMQILLVVGLTWAGTAARQGGTHAAFWLLGVAFLFTLASAPPRARSR